MSQFAKRDSVVKLESVRFCSHCRMFQVRGQIWLFDNEYAALNLRHAEKFTDRRIITQHVVKRLPHNDDIKGLGSKRETFAVPAYPCGRKPFLLRSDAI